MGDCVAYVQLPIQSVPVDHPLDTKRIKLPPVLYVKLHPSLTLQIAPVLYVKQAFCTTRKTATLCYTYNCHPVLYVKLPPCTIRKTATIC